MPILRRCVLLLLLVGLIPRGATAQTPAQLDDLLRRVDELKAALEQLRPSGPPAPAMITVPAGADLQAAIDAAPVGATLALAPGATYRSAIIRRGQAVTLTTAGWSAPDRTATAADGPGLAIIQGSDRQSYGLWVQGSDSAVLGIRFVSTPPSGQGEMLRIGDAEDGDLTHVPHRIVVRNNVFDGTPAYGQKRAIAANGADLTVDRNYAANIWSAGQDSQCVAVLSTPGPVRITRNVLPECGAENILVGGVPPAGPAFLPSDILIEGNAVAKPLRWKGADKPALIVTKNLIELKDGRRITVRGNYARRNWQGGQDGFGFLSTMATNGACSFCEMRDVLWENNILEDVGAGWQVTGYQYGSAPGAGAAVGLTFRNNLIVTDKAAWGGNGRPFFLSNEPTDVTIDHNTVIHTGNSFLYGALGKKWPYQDPPLLAAIPAGPTHGLVFTNNLTLNGTYGIIAENVGTPIETLFPGAVIAGNVIGGATTKDLARYDAFKGTGAANRGLALADFQALFTDYAGHHYCPITHGAGADCATLPFPLRALIPAQ